MARIRRQFAHLRENRNGLEKFELGKRRLRERRNARAVDRDHGFRKAAQTPKTDSRGVQIALDGIEQFPRRREPVYLSSAPPPLRVATIGDEFVHFVEMAFREDRS